MINGKRTNGKTGKEDQGEKVLYGAAGVMTIVDIDHGCCTF